MLALIEFDLLAEMLDSLLVFDEELFLFELSLVRYLRLLVVEVLLKQLNDSEKLFVRELKLTLLGVSDNVQALRVHQDLNLFVVLAAQNLLH